MTTENLSFREDARRALGQLSKQVRERHRQVIDRLRGLESERENVIVGAAAAMQSINDDSAALEEELGQLEHILGVNTQLEQEDDEADDMAHPESPAFVLADEEPTNAQQAVALLHDPRNWRFPCLILAVLAALVGLIVGTLTRNVVSDEVDNVQWLVSLIWIVASAGVGFYLVGVICAFVHARNRRR